MEQQEVEVSFCDLCGTSVPAGDLEAGKAVLHQGKTVGICCLPALRGGADAKSPTPASTSSGVKDGSVRAGEGGRLLTVGIVLLAALAAAVIFLDNRMSNLEKTWVDAQEQNINGQRSHSDVLMGIDAKLDRTAQRADVDAAVTKSRDVLASIEVLQGSLGQRIEALQQEMGAVRRELRTMASQVIDYRPLFEDLRQRHQRTEAALDAMRAMAVQSLTVAAPLEPVDSVPARPVDDLPPELLVHVQKLGSADEAVRFEAVDLLVESKNPKVLPYLLPLVKDPDAFVRRLTVEGLREFVEPEVVEALLLALQDEDENVRDTAWRSLRDVTGQKFTFQASATKDARARAGRRWQDWWAKAKATFGT